MLRENEKMLKRLQEKSGTKSRNKATSESEKNQSLAKLAGMPESSMDGITKFSSKREQLLKKSSRKNRRIDGSGENRRGPFTLDRQSVEMKYRHTIAVDRKLKKIL